MMMVVLVHLQPTTLNLLNNLSEILLRRSQISRLQVFPQNSVNQRPTTALLSSCLLMSIPLILF